MEAFLTELRALIARFANVAHADIAKVMHSEADAIERNNAADQGHAYRLPDGFQDADNVSPMGGSSNDDGA